MIIIPTRMKIDEVKALQEKYRTDKLIGKHYGICRPCVTKFRKKHGIPTVSKNKNKQRNFLIVMMNKKGKTGYKIAREIGLDDSWVYRILKKPNLI